MLIILMKLRLMVFLLIKFQLSHDYWLIVAGLFHIIFFFRYKLELHMVHESIKGEIAVVGVMYNYGRPDPFLAEVC